MSTTITIISIGALAIGAVNIYFVYRFFGRMSETQEHLDSHFSQMDIDNKISSMFSGSATRTVDGLSKLVFNQLKKKYPFKARSYAELIEEIKLNPGISIELKELLINFFNDIIRISYRDESVDEAQREELKTKIKTILEKLQQG